MTNVPGDRSQLLLVLFIAMFYLCLLLPENYTTADELMMCKKSERQALLQFKQSLQAVDKSVNSSLSSWDNKDCCEWMGLGRNKLTGYVERIELHGYHCLVAGTISPSLLKLQHLSYLDLSYNDFNGSLIPEFIGSLKNPTYLDLSFALLEDQFLLSLETFDVGDSFSGCQPASFTNPYLSDCDLPSVSSSSLISLINSSTFLTTLHLSGNNLTSSAICPWLFNVSSKLKVLDLSMNQLKGPILESNFGNMVSLKYLYLRDNQHESGINGSVLSEIAKLSSLRALDLGYNHLNGTISESIGQLSKLLLLRLAGYSFDNVVISVVHFSNLTRASFPRMVTGQIHLRALDISAAEISDSLSYWFWDSLKSLQHLNLSFNQINALNLEDNNLLGQIPFSLGYLASLEMLSLRGNRFLGELPSSLQNWKIATESQLQLFEPSAFSRNHGLCGPSVTPNCSALVEPPQGQPRRIEEDFEEFRKRFYIGMGLGFVVSFWRFCSAVLFKRPWRHSYFLFMDNVMAWFYVSSVLLKSSWRGEFKPKRYVLEQQVKLIFHVCEELK
ncbi:probable inactive leucine-rich repeat receptor kinase XIAO [Durio zibethinus]|uniref:Probable inactive leucine-rich repeat receptor kinase XIAO n=1 Tax=Durio zibethinus TaxID=66656 RepID=A0A6P5ZV74_DURZI|nr:probable inactive leucine-rich repeat receptor kinase XIAO [Durio zibethinus]